MAEDDGGGMAEDDGGGMAEDDEGDRGVMAGDDDRGDGDGGGTKGGGEEIVEETSGVGVGLGDGTE